MKQKLRVFLTLLLCAVASVGWGQTSVTIWEEDWSTGKKNDLVSAITNPNATYSVGGTSSGNYATIYEENLAGGTSPELLIPKSTNNQTFISTINLRGMSGDLTLSFNSNKNLSVTSSTSGVTITNISGTTTTKEWEYKISVPVETDNLVLTFAMTTNSNARIDNIRLVKESDEAPAPTISASDVTLEHNATSGSVKYSVSNPVDGTPLTATTNASWITNLTVGDETITFNTTTNEGDEDRTATITLSYTGASDKVVTVTQKHFEIDYAELPFNWEGGTKANLEALVGVTASGLGSDYAESHGAYRVKFDHNGDYIQIKTNERPGVVTIGVKMIGGNTASSITVQGSSDGETFSDVETLTISGSTNDILTLSTTKDFGENVRFVRLVFNKGSNVGVGPIAIARYGSVAAPSFNPLGGTFYSEQSVSLSCATEGATIWYSFDESTWNEYTEAIKVSSTKTIYAKAVVGNLESAVVSATYNIAEKKDVVFNVGEKELNYEEVYTVTRGSGKDVESDGYVTVSSSNTNVATVEGLKITAVGVGTATIALSVSEGDTYKEGSTTFTVTVKAPEGQTTAPEAVGATTIFDFTKEEVENQNEWGLPVSSTNKEKGPKTYSNGTYAITLEAPDGYYWKSGSANGGQYLLMGKNDATLTLPAFDQAVTQIDVEGTSVASTGVKQNIFVGETAVSTETTGAKNVTNKYMIAEGYQAAGTIYTLKVTSDHNTQIKTITVHFAGGEAPTITAKLNDSGYATYCNQYPLDFTDRTDVTAWALTGIEKDGDVYKMNYTQITGAVKGGVGMLLKGTAGATVSLTSVDSDNVPSGNKFVGTLAPTFVAAGAVYGLSGDTFVKSSRDGNVKANKAFIPASELPTGAKSFIFVFEDEATGVRTIETVSAEDAKAIFNIAGQRLQNLQKGINIVGGKKILVK